MTPARHDHDAGGDPGALTANPDSPQLPVRARALTDHKTVFVAVPRGRDGTRLGKGGGFSDLEFALAVAAGSIDDRAVVATTVRGVHVDLVVTPDEVIRCPRRDAHRLPRVDWSELTDGKIAAIPAPARMSGAKGRR